MYAVENTFIELAYEVDEDRVIEEPEFSEQDPIGISGRLQVRNYDDNDGQRR